MLLLLLIALCAAQDRDKTAATPAGGLTNNVPSVGAVNTRPVAPDARQLARQTAVLAILNAARTTVNPPCDYRQSVGAPASPCNAQRGNKLPSLTWAADLAQMSSDFAALCPTTSNVNLPAGLGQSLLVSLKTDQRSDDQLLTDTVTAWANPPPSAYNPVTGVAFGAPGRNYKQIIAANNQEVGCAVNAVCPRGRRVVCTYRNAPSAGPAYPVLRLDPSIKKEFRETFLKWANHARRVARRLKAPLAPLEWDDALAASAQAWADKQVAFPGDYDNALPAERGESRFVTNVVWADPALAVVVHWFSMGRFYSLRRNVCKSFKGTNMPCGKYTQLMGTDARKVGCGQAFKNGNTFVYCHFDKKYNHQGAPTVRPYEGRT